jgi:hypothetical protein
MATGNPTFTTFFSSTIRNYRKKLVENLMGHNALFWQLNKRGFVQEDKGGRSIVTPLMYGQNDTVQSYAGWDLLDVTPQQGMTSAEFDWKFIAGSVTISGEEEFKNSGDKNKIFNLLEAKIRQLELSMQLEMNSQLYAAGTANGGKDLTGLAAAVENGDSWGVYGGIDRNVAANSWWRNKYIEFDTYQTGGPHTFFTAAGSSSSVLGISAMRNLYNSCSIGNSSPTLIITTQDIYEAYEADAEGKKQRVTDTAMYDAGFQNLMFKGTPMIFDEDMDDEGLLMLNSEYLKFVIGKGRNFTTTPFVKPQNQDAKVSQVLFAGNLVTSKSDQHGRISNITV